MSFAGEGILAYYTVHLFSCIVRMFLGFLIGEVCLQRVVCIERRGSSAPCTNSLVQTSF